MTTTTEGAMGRDELRERLATAWDSTRTPGHGLWDDLGGRWQDRIADAVGAMLSRPAPADEALQEAMRVGARAIEGILDMIDDDAEYAEAQAHAAALRKAVGDTSDAI